MSDPIKTSVVFVTMSNHMTPEARAKLKASIQAQLPPTMGVVLLPPGLTVQHVQDDALKQISSNTAKLAELLDRAARDGAMLVDLAA